MSWINPSEPHSESRHHRVALRILLVVFAGFLAAGTFWMWHQHGKAPHVVHAATCDVSALTGRYGYTQNGFFFDSNNNTFFYSAAGAFATDGGGNLTGAETNSVNGGVTQGAPFSGSYTVNTDCSGSMVFNYPAFSGNPAFTSTFDFVITDGGNAVRIVETDTGNNITGVAKRQ